MAEELVQKPKWSALVALAFSTLFGLSVAIAAWVNFVHARPPGVDFASFWAAGALTLAGTPDLAYDPASLEAIERTVAHVRGALPFSYPPPFLLFVAPFAVRPFWLAYLLWIGATSALYFVAARTLVPPRYRFAHPAALVNAIIGQNGFLTASIFLFGTAMLAQYPFAGGAILGLLVIKPQLALLVPLALLAGREWRAIAGAAAMSMALVAAAAVLFGIDIFGAFVSAVRDFGGHLDAGRWKWSELASVFGFARSLGVPQPQALGLQALAALAAVIVTWRAWAMRHKQRVAVLAAATLLVPPYLFTYDSLLLIVPLAVFLGEAKQPWRAAVIWILLLLPLGGYIYPYPNTIPLAATLSLWWLHASDMRGRTEHKRKVAAPFGTATLT